MMQQEQLAGEERNLAALEISLTLARTDAERESLARIVALQKDRIKVLVAGLALKRQQIAEMEDTDG